MSCRLTCWARALSRGCSCPPSSHTMPWSLPPCGRGSGFGMPFWPPCLPPRVGNVGPGAADFKMKSGKTKSSKMKSGTTTGMNPGAQRGESAAKKTKEFDRLRLDRSLHANHLATRWMRLTQEFFKSAMRIECYVRGKHRIGIQSQLIQSE